MYIANFLQDDLIGICKYSDKFQTTGFDQNSNTQ